MTAPPSRRTAARSVALACLLATAAGCARNGLSSSGVDAQRELQEALAAARAAETRPPEREPANQGSRESQIGENLARGHHEAEAGRLDQAARFYERVLREDPSNPVAHHRLAVIADKNRDFPEAERHYAAALETRPNDPDLLNDLGYCYLLQGRYPESERTLREAVAAAPMHERAITNLGLLYGTLGDLDRALAVLRRTGSETEAREKLAMLVPAGGANSLPASAGAALPAGPSPGAILPAGAYAAQEIASSPSRGQPAQGDAMRDLMSQLDRAKREAVAARAAGTAAPGRLPGLIDPIDPRSITAAAPSEASLPVPAQPYQRSDRYAHAAARPESPVTHGSEAGYGGGLPGLQLPRNAPSLPATETAGELPVWSPQVVAAPSAQPSPPTNAAGPSASVAVGGPQGQPVQYAFAETEARNPVGPNGQVSGGHGGFGAELPPPVYASSAGQDGGSRSVPQWAGGYGHAATAGATWSMPPASYSQHGDSPHGEPGMQAYANDLARRDAEVAEMHRYMDSLRRPEAAAGPGPAYAAPDASGYSGHPR